MASRRWLRLDADWDRSEWVYELSGHGQLAWIKLLCYVKKSGLHGRVKSLSLKVFARESKVTVRAVQEMLGAAQRDGALHIDGKDWLLTAWSEYNPPDPTAAQRKRRQRDREQRGKRVAVRHRQSRRDTVTDGCDLSRDGDGDREKNGEQITETRAKALGASAAVENSASHNGPDPWDEPATPLHVAPPSSDRDGPPANAKNTGAQLAYFMPLLRDQLGYDLEGATAGSIVKRILTGNAARSPPSLERAVRGLAYARDRGWLRDGWGIDPGDSLTLRILYTAKQGVRPVWNQAVDEWYPRSVQHESKSRGLSPVRIM